MKIIERIKLFLDKDDKAEYLFKGVTVVAVAVSVILILFMLFSGQTDRTVNPPAEPINIDSNGIDTDRERHLDSTGSNNANNGSDSGETAPHLPSPSSSPDKDRTVTLSLTEDEASDLVSLSFSERFSISDVDISFFAPDLVKVQGIMGKNDLGELFSEQDLPLLRAALILAPEELEGELSFRITLEDDGTLKATPERVLVNGINVTRFIPPTAVQSANEALSSLVPEEASLREIKVEDGSITFTLQA